MKISLRPKAAVGAVLCLLAAAAAANPSSVYLYDGVGRLKAVIYEDGSGQTYSYDPAGNRTASTSGSPVIFSISPAAPAVAEGGSITFTVTKSGTALTTSTVNVTTADGTAHAGTNYTALSPNPTTLSFAPGDTSKQVTVQTTNDNTYDGSLGFSVSLTSPTAAIVGTGTSTATINEASSAPVFAISGPASVTEGGVATYTITRTGTTSLTQAVSYATANGTAASGLDYVATSGSKSFPAGTTSQTFTVSTIDDTAYEGARAFTASLSNPTNGAVLGTASASTTVNDNEPAPTFSINSPAAVNESQPITFTVTKTGSTRLSHSVNYATANGTAVAGTNYTAASGVLSFAATDTTKTFIVNTLDDGVPGSALTFTSALSSPSNGAALGSPSSGTGTINNIDAGPPSPPPSATVTGLASTGAITVNWTAPAGTVTSYNVDQSVNGGAYSQVYTGTALTYHTNHTGYQQTYAYEVQACNSYGCSAFKYAGSITVCTTVACGSSMAVPASRSMVAAESPPWLDYGRGWPFFQAPVEAAN